MRSTLITLGVILGTPIACCVGMIVVSGYTADQAQMYCAFTPAVGERVGVTTLVERGRTWGIEVTRDDGPRPNEHSVWAYGGYMTTQVICEITIVDGRVVRKGAHVYD